MKTPSPKHWRWVGLILPLSFPCHAPLAADIPSAADACVGDTPESTPSNTFKPIGDGSVVRHEPTKLEWQRCAVGQTWNGNGCDGRPGTFPWKQTSRLGKDGWRLPTADELLSIVEHCHTAPSINPQVFPNTLASFYWSSSTDTGGLNRAWGVSFFGGVPYRVDKSQTLRVRLVRGGEKAQGAASP